MRSGLEAATSITGKAVPWARNVPCLSSEARSTSKDVPVIHEVAPLYAGNGSVVSSRNGNGDGHSASTTVEELVIPQRRISVPGEGLGKRMMGWVLTLVEAVSLRAIVRFLRRTVVKVRYLASEGELGLPASRTNSSSHHAVLCVVL